jgi:glutathione peroxidase
VDFVHCKDKRLSSPVRVNLWRTAALGFLLLAALLPLTSAHAAAGKAKNIAEDCPALLNHQFPRLQDEKPISMCQFKGQVLLVVNTASFCGFTGQYEELEKVHSQYKDKSFSVVGFPSSDFGNQEYKSNKEIAAFCNNTFGVKFPMFAKTVVKGDSANPFYKQLAQASGEQPGWNFHKYLINRQGQVVETFKSNVSPTSPEVTQAIRRALDAHPITKQ